MNHFQRLNEVKELKIFFFAQRTIARKQASNRRPLPCEAMAPTVQNRAAPQLPDRTRQRQRQRQRQRSRHVSPAHSKPGAIYPPCLTSRAHRRSLSKRRDLVLSSLPSNPPPPPLSPILGPRYLKLRVSLFLVFAFHLNVSYVQSHHFPWLQPHALQSIRFSRITAIRTHPMTHLSLEEAPSRLQHTVFLQMCCCYRARRFFPSTSAILGVRGSVPVVPLCRKLD